jgi:acyl-coenzyme A thioesterase PaaI-like protein
VSTASQNIQNIQKQPNSTHCFICGVQNAGGVHVSFYETVNGEGQAEILARFTGRTHHQGYPNRMHGGVITGILDEAIGRAVNIGSGAALPNTWGVSLELTVRFLKPVPLDVELTARGRITRTVRRIFEGTGEIYLPDGEIAATATGRYLMMELDEIAAVEAPDLGWQVYPDPT